MSANALLKISLLGTLLLAAGAIWSSNDAAGHEMTAMSDSHADNAAHAHGAMAKHMRMTEPAVAKSGDEARAKEIVATMRTSLEKYRDYRVALADGYSIFLGSIPQAEYHFWNPRDSTREYRGKIELGRPGSLLYVKDRANDYRLVGAMFSAPAEATPEQLDATVPLSVARWHVHTNICLPKGITLDDLLRGNIGQDRTDLPGLLPVASNPSLRGFNQRFGVFADGRFGFTGRIADPKECAAAGGDFVPQAWGWMVHVYPFAGDDLKVAFGPTPP